MPRRFRGAVRLAILFSSLLEVLGRFALIYLVRGGRVSTARRAEWLHASCARIGRRLSLSPEVSGGLDSSCLTVSNHLTYLDILVYGAVRPFVFVAKSEVRRWPLLGTLAKVGGTIFVDRGRSLQVAEASRQIEQSLRDGLAVLVFPEGTSSDGREVLPFRSPLFEPAVRAGASVTAAAIRYHAADATESEVTYWGEMVFIPHLFRTLCVRKLAAEIRFDSPWRFSDRKTAARVAWMKVHGLRAGEAWASRPVETHSSPKPELDPDFLPR
jgi:1-acyl-sn-glycerol-3-phosphate acyltransferase